MWSLFFLIACNVALSVDEHGVLRQLGVAL